MTNPKAQIQKDWIAAKAETERLRNVLDNSLTVYRRLHMKLYAKALEAEQTLYFKLTGKRDPQQK